MHLDSKPGFSTYFVEFCVDFDEWFRFQVSQCSHKWNGNNACFKRPLWEYCKCQTVPGPFQWTRNEGEFLLFCFPQILPRRPGCRFLKVIPGVLNLRHSWHEHCPMQSLQIQPTCRKTGWKTEFGNSPKLENITWHALCFVCSMSLCVSTFPRIIPSHHWKIFCGSAETTLRLGSGDKDSRPGFAAK